MRVTNVPICSEKEKAAISLLKSSVGTGHFPFAVREWKNAHRLSPETQSVYDNIQASMNRLYCLNRLTKENIRRLQIEKALGTFGA